MNDDLPPADYTVEAKDRDIPYWSAGSMRAAIAAERAAFDRLVTGYFGAGFRDIKTASADAFELFGREIVELLRNRAAAIRSKK